MSMRPTDRSSLRRDLLRDEQTWRDAYYMGRTDRRRSLLYGLLGFIIGREVHPNPLGAAVVAIVLVWMVVLLAHLWWALLLLLIAADLTRPMRRRKPTPRNYDPEDF